MRLRRLALLAVAAPAVACLVERLRFPENYWQGHLTDDESVTKVYVDRDLSCWGRPS